MKVVIGIDVGGSTTKIVGFTENGKFLQPTLVRAADPITSIYGAFGKFTAANNIELSDIVKIMVTGVGSSYITKPIYGLPCDHVQEFKCNGLGGLYLSKLKETIVVSMGTGTAMVHAVKDGNLNYLGGTGVGGGTLIGLSKLLLGMENINHVYDLAAKGDLNKIDLKIRDITNKDILPGMPDMMTAANFGKVSELATPSDKALGIINMVFETIGMLAVFAARHHQIKDIVLIGNLTIAPHTVPLFKSLGDMFGYNFLIPENAQFGTVIGASLASGMFKNGEW
jgi:Pantothenate kinase, acetyl-CoA regulated